MGSSNANFSRHLRVLLAGGAIASMTACSPLGWYDDPAPHKRKATSAKHKAKSPQYRKAPKYRDARTTPRPRYTPPAAAASPSPKAGTNLPPRSRQPDNLPPEETAAPAVDAPTRIVVKTPKKAKPSIQIVETGRKGTYYLIDRKRQLCFFHNGGAVARVDCTMLPEAADFAKQTSPPAQPTPAKTAPLPSKPQPQVSKDARATPPAPAKTAEPAPAKPKTFRGSKKGHAAGSNQDPTGEEAARFTGAYVAIFCNRQSSGKNDPRTTIQSHGLSVERYSEIEGWMAKDERRWRSLTQAALKGCKDS